MIESSTLIRLNESFAEFGRKSGIGYLEIINSSESVFSTIYYKSLTDKFDAISVTKMKENGIVLTNKNEEIIRTSMNSQNGQPVYIIIKPFSSDNIKEGFVIFQSYELQDDNSEMIINFYSAVIEIISNLSMTAPLPPGPDNKFKNELINIRDLQAKLFPKFSDVKGLDIGSAYLPADLMSGNFIDGFHLDEDTYQFTVCDVSKYGATSTFTGAMIRTILRYEATKKMVPSVLIQTVNNKLKSMSAGSTDQIFITIYQIKLKTGKTLVSSFGPLTTFLYNNSKNGYFNLRDTEAGKLLAKRNFYKDISISLSPGDFLLYYSNGFLNATTEDGSVAYSESRLRQRIMEMKNKTSIDKIHSLIEDIYDFTNYSPLKEDIITISIMKE